METALDGIGCLTGIDPWKRKRVRQICANRHGPPIALTARRAVRTAKANGGAVACWASRVAPELPRLAAEAGVPLWMMEDGFIRSFGLGVALVQPCSIVVDRQGIHYDPSSPSDLETLLESRTFPAETLARAESLIAEICRLGITKYNLAGETVDLPRDRRVVLALGQVENDLSVICGGGGLTIAEFVAQVRREEPDAFIVFKPHPDVVFGMREGLIQAEVDLVAGKAELAGLMARADAVHTLTSLAGFEALLRGREVVVHGQPFYAGWGLTRDLTSFPRRHRRLTLAELVAGVLIEYPLYCLPGSGRRCSVEDLVAALGTGDAGWKAGTRDYALGSTALMLRRMRNAFGGKPDAAIADL
jgi:capsular polysaccharide export protein